MDEKLPNEKSAILNDEPNNELRDEPQTVHPVHHEAATPFDEPEKLISSSASPKTLPDSDEAQNSAPDPALWESIAPHEHGDKYGHQNAARDSKTLPDSVKIAGILIIVHGLCLALNGLLWGRANDDAFSMVRGLMWFGFTFVLCGGLYEKRIWAWWTATLIGGGIGVVNALAVVGSYLSRSMLPDESGLTVAFVVPVIAIAALVMLSSVALLMGSAAKGAFGMTKDNPTGLF